MNKFESGCTVAGKVDEFSTDSPPSRGESPPPPIAPDDCDRNRQFKAAMACELAAQGLSPEAIARILHFPFKK